MSVAFEKDQAERFFALLVTRQSLVKDDDFEEVVEFVNHSDFPVSDVCLEVGSQKKEFTSSFPPRYGAILKGDNDLALASCEVSWAFRDPNGHVWARIAGREPKKYTDRDREPLPTSFYLWCYQHDQEPSV